MQTLLPMRLQQTSAQEAPKEKKFLIYRWVCHSSITTVHEILVYQLITVSLRSPLKLFPYRTLRNLGIVPECRNTQWISTSVAQWCLTLSSRSKMRQIPPSPSDAPVERVWCDLIGVVLSQHARYRYLWVLLDEYRRGEHVGMHLVSMVYRVRGTVSTCTRGPYKVGFTGKAKINYQDKISSIESCSLCLK